MFAARLSCGLAVLAPVVLALPPTRAAAQVQLAPAQRAPLHPAVQMAGRRRRAAQLRIS